MQCRACSRTLLELFARTTLGLTGKIQAPGLGIANKRPFSTRSPLNVRSARKSQVGVVDYRQADGAGRAFYRLFEGRPAAGFGAESYLRQDGKDDELIGVSDDVGTEQLHAYNSSAPTAKAPATAKVATNTPYGEAREEWQIQKDVLAGKFGEGGWSPRKRLSPDAIEGVRALHAQDPAKFTTPFLADQFQVSAEAIRRILKSKWRPDEEEQEDRRQRWDKRGENIWTKMVELGAKPPKKWREMGVGMPQWKLEKDARRRELRQAGPTITQPVQEEEPESDWEGAVSQRIL